MWHRPPQKQNCGFGKPLQLSMPVPEVGGLRQSALTSRHYKKAEAEEAEGHSPWDFAKDPGRGLLAVNGSFDLSAIDRRSRVEVSPERGKP